MLVCIANMPSPLQEQNNDPVHNCMFTDPINHKTQIWPPLLHRKTGTAEQLSFNTHSQTDSILNVPAEWLLVRLMSTDCIACLLDRTVLAGWGCTVLGGSM
jgi:hypothetical protein